MTAVPSPTTESAQPAAGEFTTVPGDRRSEAPRTLAEPVPQSLSFADQLGLWGNLGVSLLGFTGALFVLQPGGTGTPELSLLAAGTALILGTVLGTLGVAVSGLPGVRTGAPAMVLLRGLFGARLSYLPTGINILQLVGWGIFELVTIATAAHIVAPALPQWGYVLIAGLITALLTVYPLGAIRVLRRYAAVVVAAVLVYLLVQLARHPLPPLAHGSWSGFWPATDTVVAVAISFAPMAADYMRHSRSERSAFAGVMIGYSITQILCYVIGLLALVTVARNPDDIYGAFIALPLGAVAFAILAARELDQSFADIYSTAVSAQNLRPLWDRRILAVVITGLATGLALLLNIADYENFLDPARFGVRADVRGPGGGLLPAVPGSLGHVRHGPVALADAAALGRRLRHLPAHQPRLPVLVGLGLGLGAATDRLHPSQLDVRLNRIVPGGRAAHAGRRFGGQPDPAPPSPAQS